MAKMKSIKVKWTVYSIRKIHGKEKKEATKILGYVNIFRNAYVGGIYIMEQLFVPS